MTGYSHALTMPWTYSAESDDRFRRILRINLVLCLLFGIAMPFLPLSERIEPIIEEPPRLATLILEVKPVPPPPKPKPVPKPLPKKVTQPEPKPVPKKAVAPKKTVTPAKPVPKVAKAAPVKPVQAKPVPVKPRVTARQKAEKSGLLALSDSLADMRQGTSSSNLRKTNQLSQNGGQARTTERAVLTSGTTRSSGGIQTASLSRNTGGGELATRSTTQVQSSGGTAASGGTVGNSDRGTRSAGRSIEEIQMVFDRNKGAIYSVYNRALRKDPTLQGKIILQLTIAPSGKVTRCVLVSSELHDAALGQKITQRVKLFNFESKDVSEITITYPIDFLPA
ncbi:MAG: AgmX/PglI C-terminal domain-containing protein [Gammaproteobacteria bacterium]